VPGAWLANAAEGLGSRWPLCPCVRRWCQGSMRCALAKDARLWIALAREPTQRFSRAWGHRLWATGEGPGRGATFVVRLPAAKPNGSPLPSQMCLFLPGRQPALPSTGLPRWSSCADLNDRSACGAARFAVRCAARCDGDALDQESIVV